MREKCKVLSNDRIAPGHFIIKFASPRISSRAKPGQFIQILTADSHEPLLPRPFSFLDADSKSFSFLYQVVGKGTEILSNAAKGQMLWITGPLGQGWNLESPDKRLLVGGGVGIPPLFHLAKELVKRKFPRQNIQVLLGARHKALLLCEKDFKRLGVSLHVATDDGSKGHRGLVTQLLDAALRRDKRRTLIHSCGPTPMLKAVSALALRHHVPSEISVEVPMACGFGACLGCALKVKAKDSHRYAIACCEGPVFKGSEIIWD